MGYMIKEIFYKDDTFYSITIKSRPKIIIVNYGKVGNKGRFKEMKYNITEKEAYHNLRAELLESGFSDKVAKQLKEKKEWRSKVVKSIQKSKKKAREQYNYSKINCP